MLSPIGSGTNDMYIFLPIYLANFGSVLLFIPPAITASKFSSYNKETPAATFHKIYTSFSWELVRDRMLAFPQGAPKLASVPKLGPKLISFNLTPILK